MSLFVMLAGIVAWYGVWALIVTAVIRRCGVAGTQIRFTTRIRVISISSMAVTICAGAYLLATDQPIQLFLTLVAVAPVAILGLNFMMVVRAGRRATLT